MDFSCILVSFSNRKYVASSSGSFDAALQGSSYEQSEKVLKICNYICCHIMPLNVAGIPF